MKRIRAAIGLAIFAAAWELLSTSQGLLLPSLVNVFATLFSDLRHGPLIRDLIHSVLRVVSGVALAILIAITLGVISGLFRNFADYLAGLVEIVRPVPPIAWTPVVIIFFGIGSAPAIAIVTLGAFFPAWFGVLQGIREIRRSHLQAAQSLGAGRFLIFTDVVVPSMLPYVIHGVRLAVGIGWFCVVAAEMMGSSNGLGFRVQLSSLNLELERLYAYLIMIGLAGYLSNWMLVSLENLISRKKRVQLD